MGNICIKRSDLMAALDAVKGAIPKKSFSAILTHVLFEGDSVWGFDSEIGVRAKLDFIKRDFADDVAWNVPFERFYNLMKSLNEAEVDIEVGETRINVKCGRHRSTVQQIVEIFPQPTLESGAWINVPTGFKEALERALLAASDREQEQLLSTVMVKGKTVLSTDRKKGVRCLLESALQDQPILLSRKAVTEIIRLGNPIKMMTTGAWSVWDYGNLQFMARLREGANEFPNVGMLMDSLGLVADELIPDGLVGILTRLKLFSEDKLFIVRDGMGKTELMAVGETTQCVEEIDSMKIAEPKKFPCDPLMEALPFADHMNWMEKNKPLFLKGQNFEYILSPCL